MLFTNGLSQDKAEECKRILRSMCQGMLASRDSLWHCCLLTASAAMCLVQQQRSVCHWGLHLGQAGFMPTHSTPHVSALHKQFSTYQVLYQVLLFVGVGAGKREHASFNFSAPANQSSISFLFPFRAFFCCFILHQGLIRAVLCSRIFIFAKTRVRP